MKRYNITIIGSGSAYTIGIINALLNSQHILPLNKLVLMDIEDMDFLFTQIRSGRLPMRELDEKSP